ncbi:MAG: DEAD/DEAH box helicase [Bacteroidales bacterium]|jgi:ATP-dependent RNA helicase RhlE|nr:DEAD/DEAH box helicase [Bacteroidales bacterium]MDD4384284.1 DEAD/DEAH box helicase [Bacteroidales bacterium]MDY0198571.1 DEAD/DEAH box helicase [Tenuifilaceae bacterium]
MKFEKYNFLPALMQNITNMGFKRPTDIQYKAIVPILNGEDVMAVAQTGTGKTAAFAMPIVHIFSTKRTKVEAFLPRCLVMVPTHELAIQVSSVFSALMKGTGLSSLALFGGIEQDLQVNMLKKGVEVLVATPGRMFDLASQGYLKFQNVEILVLDEADHMLELGFITDMDQLFRRMPRKRQTLFFSATINPKIKDLAYNLVSHGVRIHISPHDPISKNIDHSVAYIEMDDKRFFLEHVIKGYPDSKILVFVRTKVRAERVLKALERVELSGQTIHGDKEQKERSMVMSQFKTGANKVLIATDVSARGIDIPNVDIVVNYDLPEVLENYVHRVGRTGRGDKRGMAISFCSEEEREVLKQIEEYLGKPIAVAELTKDEYEATIDISESAEHDWQSLIDEQNSLEAKQKLKLKPKQKRKKKR